MTVTFDLDDTLALERDYVKSGFTAVASALGDMLYFDFLWELYLKGVRGSSFNQLLEAYPEIALHFSITELVEIYRSHKAQLAYIEGMSELIAELKDAGVKLALISDGPLLSQKAKVEALGLQNSFDLILLTDRWGKAFWKPHPRAYLKVEKDLASPPFVFVGDNPAKDFVSASQRSWYCFRLRLEGQMHQQRASNPEEKLVEVSSVAVLRCKLLKLLDTLG